jgi:hypothetical protein
LYSYIDPYKSLTFSGIPEKYVKKYMKQILDSKEIIYCFINRKNYKKIIDYFYLKIF